MIIQVKGMLFFEPEPKGGKMLKQDATEMSNFTIGKSHKYFSRWTDLEHISFS